MKATVENAKQLGFAALLEKIKAAGLAEYGLVPAPLDEKIYRDRKSVV